MTAKHLLPVFIALAACSNSQSDSGITVPPVAASDTAVPLTAPGPDRYKGFTRGLYPNGSNTVPATHAAEGRRRRALIRPLDVNGNPSAQGSIVLLSIGMSNGTQEFCSGGYVNCASHSFMGQAAADPSVNKTTLRIVNGARGGQVASVWASPNSAEYNRIRDQGLAPLGLSEQQVQVVWTKLANARPTTSLPDTAADAFRLRTSINRVLEALKTRYPNLQMVFISSRTYAGYATTDLNPEPYAYETGFAHKWAIEDQISTADYDGAWVAWGPYLWDPTWARSDFANDGTHPSQSGVAKVGGLLLDFFKTSEFTSCWFIAGQTC